MNTIFIFLSLIFFMISIILLISILKDLKKLKNKKNKTIYIYSDDKTEFGKILNCLEENKIDGQLMGYGTIETGQIAINILKKNKLKFGIVNNISEIYENKKLIKYWDDLFDEKYGIEK